MKEDIFISVMGIFLIFNIFVSLVNPDMVSILNMDLTSILVTALTVTLAAGVTIFGTGLSESGIGLIFPIIILFNILFRIDLYGFSLGIGLASTMVDVFNQGDVMGLGTLIGGSLSFIAFFTGMLMVADKG